MPSTQRVAVRDLPAELRVGRLLAERVCSTLHLARDVARGRDVVLKRMWGPQAAARAEIEARAMARLGPTPRVLEVLGIGISDSENAWVVTEYARGGSLAGAHGWAPEVLLGWAAGIATALARAHELGVVHGDVSPANVLLCRRGVEDGSRPGGTLVAKLADFGSATIDGVGATGPEPTGLHGFTPRFASPERSAGGAPTPASDVYGLARCVVELAGEPRVLGLPGAARRTIGLALRTDPSSRPAASVLAGALRQGSGR